MWKTLLFPVPLPVLLPKHFHINQPKLEKCFGWVVLGGGGCGMSSLWNISYIYTWWYIQKPFSCRDSNISLKCLCSCQWAHLLEYLQKRKYKREVNKGEVVERWEWIVISQTAHGEQGRKDRKQCHQAHEWISSAPCLGWEEAAFDISSPW